MGKTIFDKIWDAHVIHQEDDGQCVMYIDRHLIHEVTSPQAFNQMRIKGKTVLRPKQVLATMDHNVPTHTRDINSAEAISKDQMIELQNNCKSHGIELFDLNHKKQGIVHVIAPENGYTWPGMTIVCGDSHTSTHGAFGCIAFGIGTTEVEHVLTTQTLIQLKPKCMRIVVNGKLGPFVRSKDLILYIISKIGSNGATGYFLEFTGSTIQQLNMDERMTICNMSIEMGARGAIIQPDEITYKYLINKEFAPKGSDWNKAVAYWNSLKSDVDCKYDAEYSFDAGEIPVMITYGTNPGMAHNIYSSIDDNSNIAYKNALKYMDFKPGMSLPGLSIDYIFIGSCTNSRMEDLRDVANLVRGHKVSSNVKAWIVPGSTAILDQMKAEGIYDILVNAGFDVRHAGCSACLAMNEDKIPEGKICLSTSNRNFEGRQGPGSKTILVSPITAAASAIKGKIVHPDVINNLNNGSIQQFDFVTSTAMC